MTTASFTAGVIIIGALMSLVMSVAWLVEQRTKNSGWIDTVWTFGLGAVGIIAALFLFPYSAAISARQILVATIVTVWSVRLGLHIARRSAERADDPRYGKLREGWGAGARFQMWLLLQKQAVVSVPMGAAIWLAARNPATGLNAQDFAAMLIMAIAIVGESIADRQLRRFAKDNRNSQAVCDVGLWRWSRHPNYFFEWLGWLAYPLIAIDYSGAYPFGWFALAGPACMYWLLVFVSGIPPLEEYMLQTRGEAFRRYQKKNSAFFPIPTSSLRG